MDKYSIKRVVIVFLALVLAACSTTPQPTVNFSSNNFSSDNVRIGYIVSLPDKATTHIYGAGCLLCYGVASALTSSLDKHLRGNVNNDELTVLSDMVKQNYVEKTANAELIDVTEHAAKLKKLKKFKTKAKVGFAKKDHRGLRATLNIDHLVILTVQAHGAVRNFANYIPTSDPQGFVRGSLIGIDLSSNEFSHFVEFNQRVQPDGEWDADKTYPTVMMAYYQAVENAKELIKSSFATSVANKPQLDKVMTEADDS